MPVVVQPRARILVLPRKPQRLRDERRTHARPPEGRVAGRPRHLLGRVGQALGRAQMIVMVVVNPRLCGVIHQRQRLAVQPEILAHRLEVGIEFHQQLPGGVVEVEGLHPVHRTLHPPRLGVVGIARRQPRAADPGQALAGVVVEGVGAPLGDAAVGIMAVAFRVRPGDGQQPMAGAVVAVDVHRSIHREAQAVSDAVVGVGAVAVGAHRAGEPVQRIVAENEIWMSCSSVLQSQVLSVLVKKCEKFETGKY